MLIHFSKCVQLIEALHGKKINKVFHVGAHAGEEAEAYAKSGVESVVWFEANTDLVPALNVNVNKHAISNTIVPYGLFNENKLLKFNVTNNFQSSSLFDLGKHSQYYPSIKVVALKEIQCYRLDSLIELEPPFLPWSDFNFINIDTQGAELAVLQGLGKHINNVSLKGIYLEVNRESLYLGIPLVEEIDRFLQNHGFHRVLTAWTGEGWGDALYLKTVDFQY
jgi:FkbM family methyltransferase